jgi:hypothetical protein
VFSHYRFVWLGQTNVPVVFLDPGINRTASLPNVNLTTLARYAVDAREDSSEHHTRRRENLKSHMKCGGFKEDRLKMEQDQIDIVYVNVNYL